MKDFISSRTQQTHKQLTLSLDLASIYSTNNGFKIFRKNIFALEVCRIFPYNSSINNAV